MASYKLVEVENAQAKYDLLCDNEVALKNKTSEEIYQYLHTVIKPGDTYQEIHKSKFDFPVLSYEEVREQKRKQERFDINE
ncbi:MAG: hypothetical protein IPJ90_23340 [Anaerolineaceae bacterium]|nr:hypothetical protein [Anaerolineaceae bacterium]